MHYKKLSFIAKASFFFFLNLILFSNSHAGGGISYAYGVATDDSWSQAIDSIIYTEDYRWSADFSYIYTDVSDEEQDETQDRYASVSHYFENNFSLSIYIEDYDEHILEIKTKGIALSLSINEWLNYSKYTLINLDYSEALYRGKGRLRQSLVRNGYTHGLDQEITEKVGLGYSYTHYKYSEDPKLIVRQAEIFEFILNRPRKAINLLNVSSGLVDVEWSVYTGWQILDNFYASLSYSHINYFFDSHSTIIGLDSIVDISDQLYMGVNISRLEDDETSDTKYFDFSLGYVF